MYNLILHTTTACNYNCTYCDVIKDNKIIPKEKFGIILDFVEKNFEEINRFKFFGGEPLLNWKTIKFLIDNSKKFLANKYEIVTNTTLLRDEIGEYFENYFKIIFFSIDSENNFDFEKVLNFIKKYNLEKKLYFNLIIDPKNIEIAEKQFQKLYENGMKGYNILPVYFTKIWEKEDLEKFSKMMKNILDLSQKDKTLRLYGFTENNGENSSLINNSFFINTDLEVYFSDFPSTFLGQKIKDELFLGKLEDFSLKNLDSETSSEGQREQNLDSETSSEGQRRENLDSEINLKGQKEQNLDSQINLKGQKNFFEKQEKIISDFEKNIYNKVKGQRELHKIMDYFSVYLTKKLEKNK